MKKINRILGFLGFPVAYALAFSLGVVCLLFWWSIGFSSLLPDGVPAVMRYPRFVPFCFVVGILATLALVVLAVVHFVVSERLSFTKKTVWGQILFAFVLSLPLTELWEMLFRFLRRVL